MRITVWLPIVALSAALLSGQSSTGEIAGRVLDASGSAIAGTRIDVRSTGTGERREFQTDETGNFVITSLMPGDYAVSAEKEGFQRFVQEHVNLQVGQRIRLEVRLEVGSVTDSIRVDAQVSMLETDDASLGQAIENRKILDLPLNGRNIVGMAALAPNVVPGNGFGGGITSARAALVQAETSNISINGGLTAHNDVLIDGVPLSICCQNQIAFLPSIDTTEEFRVRTNMFDAQFGRTSGGIISYASKAGTNEYHGSVFEFVRNAAFDANNFFSNRSGLGIGHYTYNQFGGRIGGPILHDRLFFFANFEGIRNRKVNYLTGNVPTEAERSGLFSVAVYDPLSTTLQGTTYVRTAFPGNQIPVSRQNPVAINVAKLWPTANSTVPGNNYLASAPATDVENQTNARVDYLVSQQNRLFGRYSYNHNNGDIPDWFHNIASTGDFSQQIRNQNAVLNDTVTFTPTFIGSFTYGYTRQANRRQPRSYGADLTSYGWPAVFDAARQTPAFPKFSLTSYLGLSSNALFVRNADVHSITASFDKIIGRHDVKFGFDGRLYRANWVNNNDAAGNFSFTTAYTRGPNAQTGANGSAYASYLLGYPASGDIQNVQPFSSAEKYIGLYLQDDYRISNKLTLNIGLRWEADLPWVERYNRLSYFDPNVASPLAASTGIAGLKGGLQFLGVNGNSRRQQAVDWNNLGPRVGFAWTAAPKLVVRGGYGIVFLPISSRYNSNSNQGFSATTNFLSSVDGLTPVGNLTNPFPTGAIQPTGAASGLSSSLGQSLATLTRESPSGYAQQFSLSLQYALAPGLGFEAAYSGSKGTKLPVPVALNNLPSDLLSQGTALLQTVSNPFQPYVSSGTLSAATVTRLQLLKPFPQFLGITDNVEDIASSSYHSVTFKLEKRMAHGISLLAAFTGGKLITDSTPFVTSYLDAAPGFQDVYNRRLDRSLASSDISRRLAVSFVVELPFGRGKALLGQAPRLVDFVLGGWQLNGIGTFQTGQPIVITYGLSTTSGATRPNNNGHSAKLSGSSHERLLGWFDTSVFSATGAYQFGNTGRVLPDVRADGSRNFDVSLFKNFRITERIRTQFRSEFFNILNTPRFAAPGSQFGASGFGVVSSQANEPREMQLALRVTF